MCRTNCGFLPFIALAGMKLIPWRIVREVVPVGLALVLMVVMLGRVSV